MDENIVAVHMIESVDGTYTTFEVIKQEKEDISDDCVVIERNGDHNNSDTHAITDDIVEQVMIDDEKEIEDELVSDRENTSIDEPILDEKQDQTSGEDVMKDDDIIIAEAVYVTQYRCKFCARLYDTIDKVKNHYIQEHENNDDNNRVSKAPQNIGPRLKNEEKSATEINSNSGTKTLSRKVKSNARKVDEPSLKRRLEFIPTPIPPRDTTFHRRDRVRSHTEQRPYRCKWTDCGLSFDQASALKSHTRTHTGQESALKSHVTRTHTYGEKPYRCEWPGCRLSFSVKNNVKVHMRTHTGEKPYHCDWPGCERKFAVKGNLDEHNKVVHSREQFVF